MRVTDFMDPKGILLHANIHTMQDTVGILVELQEGLGGITNGTACYNAACNCRIDQCTVKYFLCILISVKSDLLSHDLGYGLRNTEGRDHQQNKIYILRKLEKCETLTSQCC